MADYADKGHWGLEDIPRPTPEDEHRARLLICLHAHDQADAQQLLEAVGLL